MIIPDVQINFSGSMFHYRIKINSPVISHYQQLNNICLIKIPCN